MDPYPFDSISLNGRTLFIKDILEDRVTAVSDFEASVLSFTCDWFSGCEKFIQRTSGSTGSPKVIELNRSQLIASAHLSAQALNLSKGQTALLCLTPSYIAGKMMLVRSFVLGMRIIAIAPSNNPFLELPHSQPIDFVAMVPSQVYEVVRSSSAPYFQRIKTVIIGGAALDAESQQMLKQFHCKFYATYGMTETLSHVALKPLNGVENADYFTSLPGIEFSTDHRGCLVIRWDNLDQHITTNDIVEIIDSTRFRWLGRWDNLINSGGVKIVPEEVEAKMAEVFRVLGLNVDYMVGGIVDQKLGHRVILAIEGNLDPETLKKIQLISSRSLSPHEVPKEIRTGVRFTHTENGKVNRQATFRHISGLPNKPNTV